jgi:hypothetical protein
MTLSPRDRRLCKAKIESLTLHESQTIIFLNNREGVLLGYLEMIEKKFVQALLRCEARLAGLEVTTTAFIVFPTVPAFGLLLANVYIE